MTGHQPELFHPGVWVKNFATAALAKAHGGLGLNLIVDNDIPKSSWVRVPQIAGEKARIVRVDFDHWTGEAPFEDLPVHDEEVFASFGDAGRCGFWGEASPTRSSSITGPALCGGVMPGFQLGLRLALARHEIEASWGACNLEIPLSHVCQSEGFFWFACHLLAQLPKFQEIHNQMLTQYRALYGIRSKNHPVAALAMQGEWREAPFWVWRRGQPRRRPLLVKQGPRTMLLRIAGEDDPLIELPLSPDREACCAVERLRELGSRSVRLRTRALTTTMFARYLLGDLFLHGIGGAKYDELGDSIARRFFGIEPPGFLTLSMTLWLGLADHPSASSSLASIDRGLRDLLYNPDRALSEPIAPEARNLIRAKQEAVGADVSTRGQRVSRFRKIRAINQALEPYVRPQIRLLEAQKGQALVDLDWNRVVRSREYPFVVHSAHRLRDIMIGLERSLEA